MMRRGRNEPIVHSETGVADGEMRRRVREFDWAETPLGPRDRWSPALNLSTGIMLGCAFPMALRWGPRFIMLYNDAYAALLGDKHPAALGRPLREVWPEIYDVVGPISDAILRGERAGFFAEDHPWTLYRHGVPEEARFTTCYSPVPDPSAQSGIGGILVTSYETTHRVANERRLRVLSSQLAAEVQQRSRERDRIWMISDDLLGVSSFAGYFTSVNPAWTRLLGWSEEEIKRLHVSALRHPDDAPSAIAGRKQLAEGVPNVRMENRFRHRDGSWRWISWTMTADGGLIYVAGRHVTAEKEAAEALRRSEEQFRALVAGVIDYAIFMLNPEGIVSSWNAGAERIKGYDASEIIGKHFSEFYTKEDKTNGLPDRALSIAAATGKFEAEGQRVRKDGSTFWANVVIDAIYNDKRELIGFAKITRDITEQRNTRAALEHAQEQLAQAQKMEALGQLTGGVAHDFNNLLMIVSGQAQSLAHRLTEPKDVRSLDAIQAAAARGEALTRQLLTFARRQLQNPRSVSPSQTINAFRDVLASSVRGNVDLEIEISRDSWPIFIDIQEFELALVNLVVNARDAMPDGGTVTLSAQNVRLDPRETTERLEGEFVAFTVADTGSGIAPDVLSRVFEPFFTTKSAGKGTGLGLSQVYGFAKQNGGAVIIDSQPEQGTAVTVYLPRSRAPLSSVAVGEPDTHVAGSGETILVVEDNPDVKTVAVTLLEQLNYRTQAVDSAEDALALLANGTKVDLVFTDVMLPGNLDGLELAQSIRERYPHIPVVLTSGYATALAGQHGLPILRKPYRIAALGEAIRNNLGFGAQR